MRLVHGLALSLCAAGCATGSGGDDGGDDGRDDGRPAGGDRDPGKPKRLIVARAAVAPVIDGRADDPAWNEAKSLRVPVKGPMGERTVDLRAVLVGDVLHVAAKWDDATEDRAHKVWTAAADGTMKAGPEREDVLAFGFPIRGEFVADMTAPVECAWDVWQWKSARTDGAGYAMDKSHVHTFADPGGKRYAHKLDDGRTLHIARPEDKGASATKSHKAPAAGSPPAPQFEAQTPGGSAADVRAKGAWRNGRWTVELARRLATGQPDDAVIDLVGDGGTEFVVAVFDRCEDEHHATSDVLRMRVERSR
ncbi:MAG: hypothetical protein HMLKMBBP_03210 [Planctomycetes bacterium]|nr:hypothetical protein [Planctomycetota bacterium]